MTGPPLDRGESWIEDTGHVMIIVPDVRQLEGMSTDPASGGRYVMWKGTPYAHIMVPMGAMTGAH